MSGLWERLLRLLFPPKCACCGELTDWYRLGENANALCAACLSDWEREQSERCIACGELITVCTCMPDAMQAAKCAAFRKLGYYRNTGSRSVQNTLIYRIKNTRDRETVALLSERLLPALQALASQTESTAENTILTYIPRSAVAKLAQGTDQAQELAHALSRASGLPMRPLIRRRRGKHRQQKRLSAAARMRNAKESFCISSDIDLTGKTIFLIDDIVTTGASMAVCTRLLRRAHAKTVCCLAIAAVER